MSKSNFVKKSLILILSNLITSILGFIYSITLSKQLGPEGMGLYGLVRPIFRTFSSLVSGGLDTAVSKISAGYYGLRDYRNFKRNIKTILTFTLLWATFISILLFLFSPFISMYIIKDARTVNALKLLCPALVFMALSDCLKGYFFSTMQVNIPILIDIFEKAIKILILIFIIKNFKVVNISTTVAISYLVLCIGECISFALLYGSYKLNIKKFPSSMTKGEGRAQLLYNTLSTASPLLLTALITSILSTCSALTIPRRLVSSGIDYRLALGMIGKFNGMAMNIVTFPMVVIHSISILLIPDLSQNLSRNNYKSVNHRISKALEISFILGSTTLIIALCLGNNLGMVFYSRNDLGSYIKFAALTAPISYTAATTFGILNGLGKQKIILRNSIFVSLLRILLLYILTGIPSINIYGYGIATIITSFISLSLNMFEIKKLSHLELNPYDIIIDILIIMFIYFVLTFLLRLLIASFLVLNTVIIIVVGFLMVFLLKRI